MNNSDRVKNLYKSIRTILHKRSVRIAFSIFAFVFAIVVLGLLLNREKDALVNHAWSFNPWVLIATFLVYVIDLVLVVWVWRMIIHSAGSKLTFCQHFRFVSISNLFKRLPGTLWYVIGRGDLYQQEELPLKMTALASGVEMFCSIIGGLLVTLIFAGPILANYPAGNIVLFLLIFVGIIFIHPRVLAKIFRFFHIDKNLFNYKLIVLWICLYCLIWTIGGLILFLMANIIAPVGLENFGYIVGSWSLVGVLSYSLYLLPSHLGFNEIGLSLLLSAIVPSSLAVLIALISRVLLLFYEILIAVLSVMLKTGKVQINLKELLPPH